jgi:hypothetical protein
MKAIYFFSIVSPACKLTTPIVLRLKKEGVNITMFDIARYADKARQNNVKVVPTLIVKDWADNEVQRLIKTFTEAELRAALSSLYKV